MSIAHDSQNGACISQDVSSFLAEMSELYAFVPDGNDVLKQARLKLIEWRWRGIDVASYINKPIYKNGETELMFTFRWACDLNKMINWFKLLIKFGGNPVQNNSDGLDAYQIALMRFKEEGLEEEFLDFVDEVKNIERI